MSKATASTSEFKAGWPVLVAAMAGFYVQATFNFTIGAFIAPIEAEFGWTRAQISIGVTVITLAGAALSIPIGMLVDRWGPRRLGVPGSIIFAITFGLPALTNSNIWVWWGLWLLLAFAFVAIKPLIWTTAVASTFDRKRGIALAIALCGNGLASTFAPSLATWAIDAFGWRMAFPVIGAIVGLSAFPILYFGLHSGADVGKGKRANQARKEQATRAGEAAKAAPPVSGSGAIEAFKSPQFFKLALAAFLFTFAAIGIVPNLIPILSSVGISRVEAAAIAGVAGLASIGGRLVTGVLLDRFNPNIIAGTIVVLPIASCLLLLAAPGDASVAILAAFIIGAALGSEVDVIAFMTARLFGTARYGTIFGAIAALWSIASGTSMPIVNLIYDMTGGYELALKFAIPIFAVTSALLFALGKPLDFEGSAAASGQ